MTWATFGVLTTIALLAMVDLEKAAPHRQRVYVVVVLAAIAGLVVLTVAR